MPGENKFEIIILDEKKSTTPDICRTKKLPPIEKSYFATDKFTLFIEGRNWEYLPRKVTG